MNGEPPPPPSVLLVDDQPESLGLLSELLGAKGYQVRPVLTGRLAIQAAARAAPDLVLLDIFMPDMGGFEVCRQIKAIPGLAETPVLFLSAYGDRDDKVAAFRCGGVDYITKPFQAEEVEARVATHLKLARMRRELETANRSLAAANGELELFAHTAAHDLRAPLRHVISYLDLLGERLAPMDDCAAGYLGHAFRSARRMEKLIQDLLAYSKSARDHLRREATDLDALVQGAVEQLEPQTRNRRIRWVLDPLPRVEGDPSLLRLVFQNLLDNALKFSSHAPEAVIEVRPLEHGTGFLVRDNGIGFEAAKAEEIFIPFKRLHRQDQFEGTGLGLAHVQRIVARHGGRVWAEGAPGQGATFRVALPGARAEEIP